MLSIDGPLQEFNAMLHLCLNYPLMINLIDNIDYIHCLSYVMRKGKQFQLENEYPQNLCKWNFSLDKIFSTFDFKLIY